MSAFATSPFSIQLTFYDIPCVSLAKYTLHPHGSQFRYQITRLLPIYHLIQKVSVFPTIKPPFGVIPYANFMQRPELTQVGFGNVIFCNSGPTHLARYHYLDSFNSANTSTTASNNDSSAHYRDQISISQNPSNRGRAHSQHLGPSRLTLLTLLNSVKHTVHSI